MRGGSCHNRLMKISAILLSALLWLGWTTAGAAAETRIAPDSCHAVTAVSASDVVPKRFDCRGGNPAGYQRASLWYQVDLTRHPQSRGSLVLMVHNSRFDRLAVAFSYADGVVLWQQVRAGSYGEHWRSGGQITFEAPERDSPLKAATLRFDRPASAKLLRMRLMSHGEEARQATALAASVGAALMLLLIGALFNASLACAIRRQFPAWQSAWSACMLLWGATWSQVHLFLFPGMAGTYSAQLCTALACLAITLATAAAITAPDRNTIPRALRIGTLALGTMIGLLGVPLAFMRTGPIDLMGDMLGILTLVDLVAVASCLGIAWRRGSQEAIGFIVGWSLPMLMLGATQFIDTQMLFWGGGAQILVLFAAAWQTLWLSIAASRTHARLRIERDRARSAEAHAHELARRDPLTGLRNRRGFIEAVTPMLDLARSGDAPVALLLIDLDMFKAVNDAHGHDAGDRVLVTVARRLARWEGSMCTAARMGGEEFALMIGGLDGFALARFAESVCREIAACEHGLADIDRVTISIGVAEAVADADFRHLYRRADEALYRAKHQGRNRAVMSEREIAAPEAPEWAARGVG
jgi:diguanylate cyclase (GGDEF)-like protein